MENNKKKYPVQFLFLLDDYLNIHCHSCLCKINLEHIIYKKYIKQNKFYYCSKECYNFF